MFQVRIHGRGGQGQHFQFRYDYCKGCGIRVSECPCGAIALVPETV